MAENKAKQEQPQPQPQRQPQPQPQRQSQPESYRPARDGEETHDPERERMQRRYDELERELEELREAGIGRGRPAPRRPSFGLSEGERADLQEHGVTVDPFVGGVLNVLEVDGVEPGNDRAQKAAERELAGRPGSRKASHAAR